MQRIVLFCTTPEIGLHAILFSVHTTAMEFGMQEHVRVCELQTGYVLAGVLNGTPNALANAHALHCTTVHGNSLSCIVVQCNLKIKRGACTFFVKIVTCRTAY